MSLHLTLSAPTATIDAADTDARTLAGVAIPYGEAGSTSAGRLTIDAGAIRVPDQLRRIKLFREHGRQWPVGYATVATDSPDRLDMTFAVGRTPDGDTALLEATEGIRDALSVELDNVTIEAGHVTGADLVAVAQVAVPAFRHAVLTSSDEPDPRPDTDDPDAGPGEPDPDPDPATIESEESDTMPETTETTDLRAAALPSAAALVGTQLPPDRAGTRTPDRGVWAAQAAAAMRGATDAAQVNAALHDVTPANAGTDDLFPRPAWIGQLWTPQAASRPLVDAIGVSPLTAMEMQGWKWTTEPQVAPYAGNKAEIPTSPAVIGPASAAAQRIAGGWDLDRIYIDFNTGFLQAFQEAAVRDYRRKSQTYFVDGHGAITGPPAVPAAAGFLADATDLGSAPDLTTGLNMLVGFLTGNGANVSFVALASDVFSDFMAIDTAAAPWWLQGQGSVSLNGTANVGGTAVVSDPALASGTVVAGDRDAVTLWETGPINVQAINLPNGGIDFALFGYWAQMVHDDDGLAKVSVTAAAGTQSSRTAKKA